MRDKVISLYRKVWPILKWILLVVGIVILIGSIAIINETYIHKPFWDWLDLLIIPAMLALGAWWVNHISQQNEQRRADNENRIEREIASERNQEAALQNYLDKMTELLLKEDLRTSGPEDEVRTVARTRTLTVLRSLGPERKGSVVQFLLEAVLIVLDQEGILEAPIVSLEGADLSRTNLSETRLRGSFLYNAILREANLSGTNLSTANLTGADLTETNLTGTDLSNAKLREASLCRATLRRAILLKGDLREANLNGANLSMANLTGADLTGARLHGATITSVTLTGATLPNGTTWTPETDMSKFTEPESDWNKAKQSKASSDNPPFEESDYE